MRNKKVVLVVLMAVLLLISGCSFGSDDEIDLNKLNEYKGAYVGDNSAVSAIAYELEKPIGEQIASIELKTVEEPYGVIVNYEAVEVEEEYAIDYAKTAITNGALMLLLVQNADWVTFNYVYDDVTITKTDMEQWLGKSLKTFMAPLQLTSYMEFYFEDPVKVSQLYVAHQ